MSSPMILDGAEPRSRATDPVTSVDAGRKADLNGSQQQALSFLRDQARTGAETWTLRWFVRRITSCLEDLQAQGIEVRIYSPERYRSAVSELAPKGLIRYTGETFVIRGRKHREWVLAEVAA